MATGDALRGFSEELPRDRLQAEVRDGRRDDGAGVYAQWAFGGTRLAQCGQLPEAVIANLPADGERFAYRLVADPDERQALVRRLYRLIEDAAADRP